MKNWSEVKNNIKVITEEENDELQFKADIVSTLINKRNELGISQRKLAEMTGIKQSAIARFESLKVMPQLNTIYKIIHALNLKIEIVDNL